MKKLLLTIAALALMAGAASADVLWDQSNVDLQYAGFWNSQSGCGLDWSGATVFAANDIMIYDEVTIESITTWYDKFEMGIEAATQAYLWIAPKAGSLPVSGVDDPVAQGTLVPVTVDLTDPNFYVVHADGLNEMLSPGNYWIALTPIFPSGFWGANYNTRCLDSWGDDTASWEICAQINDQIWQNVNPGMDASIMIEGSVRAVPVEGETWGGLKALYR